MERSRRQWLANMGAVLGAVLARASGIGRRSFGRKRPAASEQRAGRGTPAAHAPRVRPAAFTVKRHD